MIRLTMALIALAAGGVVYLLWRPDTLLMFLWLDSLGVSDILEPVRRNVREYFPPIPFWARDSLPNALWLFSGLVCLSSIWDKGSRLPLIFWSSILLLIAVLSELAQLMSLLPGTFDVNDVIALLGAGLLGWVASCPKIQTQGD